MKLHLRCVLAGLALMVPAGGISTADGTQVGVDPALDLGPNPAESYVDRTPTVFSLPLTQITGVLDAAVQQAAQRGMRTIGADGLRVTWGPGEWMVLVDQGATTFYPVSADPAQAPVFSVRCSRDLNVFLSQGPSGQAMSIQPMDVQQIVFTHRNFTTSRVTPRRDASAAVVVDEALFNPQGLILRGRQHVPWTLGIMEVTQIGFRLVGGEPVREEEVLFSPDLADPNPVPVPFSPPIDPNVIPISPSAP